MAKVKNNNASSGISGRVDQFVFKQSKGKTVVSKVPYMDNVKWSDKQQAHRKLFKQAQRWATWMLADPQMNAYYSVRTTGDPRNAAISNYMRLHRGLNGKYMA